MASSSSSSSSAAASQAPLLDEDGAADKKQKKEEAEKETEKETEKEKKIAIAIAIAQPPPPLLRQQQPIPPPPLPLPRPAAAAMPEYRSISAFSQPPCALKPAGQGPGASAAMATSTSPATSPSCSACGRDGASLTLHRLSHAASSLRLCSLCVLSRHRGMYCSLCFLVYPHSGDIGDPGLWLTCSKCQRLCHLDCARARDIPTDSLFFDCSDCLQSKQGSSGDPILSRDASSLSSDASILNRDASSLNRDASSLNRDALSLNRDASSLNRDASSLNRDASSLNRDASSLNRDASSLNRDASGDAPNPNGDSSGSSRDASGSSRDASSSNRDASNPNSDSSGSNIEAAANPNSDLPALNSDLSSLNGDASGLNRDASGLNRDASGLNRGSASNMDSNSQSDPNLHMGGDEGSMSKKLTRELPDVAISTAGGGCGAVVPAGSNKKPRDSSNLAPEAEECGPNKKPRFCSELCREASPEEALAAAQIVANIALRQAKEAKDKARALASSSAKASARAKLALDAAHRAAVEEARFRNEMLPRPPSVSSSLYPRKGLGPPPYPPSPATRSDHVYPQAFPRPPPHEGLIAKRLNTTTTTNNNNINNNNNNNNNGNVGVRPSFTAPYHHPNHPRIKSMPAPPPPPSSVSLNSTHSNMVARNPGVQKAGTANKAPVEQNHHTASPSSSLCRAAPSSQQGVLQGQAQVGDPEIGASKVNETNPRAMGPSSRVDPSSPGAMTPSSRVDASAPSENQHTNSGCLQDQVHVGDLAVKANENDASAQVPSGTSQMHVPRSDAVTSNAADTAMDCSFPATCPVTSAMVTDTLGELKPLSPASGHAVDDFVDMGILLAEECEKIKQNGMVVEANVGVSDRSDSVSVKVDSAKDDQVLETPPNNVLNSGKESIDKESNKYDGEGLADDDEKAQCVHDDNAPVATKVH